MIVSARALERSQIVQGGLPNEIDLVLTRGYEPPTSHIGWLRKLFRIAGIALFRFVYTNRRDEVEDIFGANGHDTDGTHIDVSLSVNGSKICLLPLSVFTPISWQKHRIVKYSRAIGTVKTALVNHGFQIHKNGTESNQIHCDLVDTET